MLMSLIRHPSYPFQRFQKPNGGGFGKGFSTGLLQANVTQTLQRKTNSSLKATGAEMVDGVESSNS